MTEINKDIEKYLSQVKAYLPCRKADKTAIIKDIRQATLEFAENSGAETIDDIYNRFGTPEEIAKAYLSDAEPQNIKKAINIKKMLLVAIVIALAMLAIAFIIAIIDSHSQNIAYYYNSDVIKDVTTTSSAVTIQVSHISLKASKT